MKKAMFLVLGAIMVFALAACNGGRFKRTSSGLMYKIISSEKNPVVKPGQFLKVEFAQKLRDSLLGGSADGLPAYIPVDSSTAAAEYDNPAEVFRKLRLNDSAVIVYEADTIRKKNGGQLPPFLKSKDKIFLTLRVVAVLNSESEVEADRKLAYEAFTAKQEVLNAAQKEKDIKALEALIKTKGAQVQKAPKGTFVEILKEGTGASCDSGKFVSVNYTGTSVEGEPFDSNVDSSFGHAGQPYVIQMGGRGAIEGWMDGIKLLRDGSKARLYVPSTLGYGKAGSPPRIKPDQNLIFDIEIVKVDTVPPARR